MGQRPKRQLTKKMASIWKDAPHPMLSRRCKLKQWDTTTHLTEWPKAWTPDADVGVEKQELPFIVGGNAKWYSYHERQFGSLLQN